MSQQSIKTLKPRMPIAIVRLDNLEDALEISGALLEGGITTLEFTLTNAQANEVITKVRHEFGERLIVGAGTVLDGAMGQASIDAGAQFLVTPILALDVIEKGKEHAIPVVCGSYTPTEIWTAWKAGASLVKVFPASQLGPTYFKDVLAPLPDLKLVPTGGVNLQTCAAFLKAGAYTVAVGSQLVSKEIVNNKDWAGLTTLARQYSEACQ
ncbi:bifunctional 4-hydroxy-2-oxoglutarate aldolase/2-dehydro-3-deoxy-phosphogluconate aldolase [Dictyobacter kobayashii]|uniref:2-dehydro-3-deoxy-phosphogluconate aldolase n=1 Tax=Dictyobacter kobayashii TaxID=2014872 RepID=A0A402AJG9_9CHLR|nr:bifunctional 4-hydroxy-2-oxoglutarate aldolase/2-dehydro-3-deoxy-phosphogluconate aldolase [Dictyobacter kobayashii]GCE19261.1 2-dehydro-3-deoxy-phosphogluconate aldolase [Dictyobacter kobayashii]